MWPSWGEGGQWCRPLGLSKAVATVPQTWGTILLVPNPGLATIRPLFSKDSEPTTPPELFRPPQTVGRGHFL